MSSLPPPWENLLPLAKSAPLTRVSTNRGISAGSVEPSASIITMMSHVAAAKPHASALPLPARVCGMITASGQSLRATSMVSSTEFPSTTTISSTVGIRSATYGRFSASLRAGITTVTVGSRDASEPSPSGVPGSNSGSNSVISSSTARGVSPLNVSVTDLPFV